MFDKTALLDTGYFLLLLYLGKVLKFRLDHLQFWLRDLKFGVVLLKIHLCESGVIKTSMRSNEKLLVFVWYQWKGET